MKKAITLISPRGKLAIFLYTLAVLWFCHHFIIRPVILEWGSSSEVRQHKFAGDTIAGNEYHTRAVLISATPEQVWPWLQQIGQDRAGFYSYQFLENMVGAKMKNVFEIRPEFQVPRSSGDTIWLAAKEHYDGNGYQIIAETKPYESIVMVGGDDFARIKNGETAHGAWAFYLYSPTPGKTWLIARSSYNDKAIGNNVLRYIFYEVPHFIMERKMLVSIKRLVEDSHR